MSPDFFVTYLPGRPHGLSARHSSLDRRHEDHKGLSARISRELRRQPYGQRDSDFRYQAMQ